MALLLVSMVVLATGFEIAIPFLTQQLVDTLIDSFRTQTSVGLPILFTLCGSVLVATALTRGFRSFYNYHLFRTVTRMEDEVKYKAYEHYFRMDALFHHGTNSGQMIGRIERGCSAVQSILFDIVGQNFVPPLIVFAGVMAALLMKNAWIALAVFLPVPIYLIVVSLLTRRIYEIEQQGCLDFETVSKESYDVASNVLTVKKFCRERAEILNQKRLQGIARNTQFRGERLWVLVENTQSTIATLGRVSVIGLGGWFVLSQRATVGEFVLYLALQDMVYQPICQLSIIFPRLRRSMSLAERLFSVLDEKPAVVEKPNAPALPRLDRDIEFRNVWFRYSNDQRWILKNVNLRIPAGSTVALVGRSGSGKTTMMNLLMRSFDPQQGQILIDGVDIRDVTIDSLRGQMAVVPQEVDLFSRTIAENIRYGKPDATGEEVRQAAALALAHDFICRTEEGYDTPVGERGLKLSGGERQRIGIARAVLRDPSILILDEATSHLDTESEQLIQKATERVIRNRTSFLIAHRLSTILHADTIIVFDGDRIEAVGTHKELCETSPTYRKLYRLHLEGARADHAAAGATAV